MSLSAKRFSSSGFPLDTALRPTPCLNSGQQFVPNPSSEVISLIRVMLKCLLMFIGQFLSGYGQHSLTEMIPRVWGLVGWGIWEGGIRTGLEVITGCSSLSREEGLIVL